MVVGEGEHHLRAFELELRPKLVEDSVAHSLGNALKIARNEHRAASLGVFEREGFHPQVVELAVGRPLRSVAREPDSFLRSDDRLGQTRLPFGTNAKSWQQT